MFRNSQIALFLFLGSSYAFAASCCGGAASLPSLITGDDFAQWSISFRAEKDVGFADTEGTISPNSDFSETSQSISLQGAYRVFDLWQVGVAVPFVRRAFSDSETDESGLGIGDIRAHVGFEFLPERTYSPYVPRAIAYAAVTVPSGTSTYSSDSMTGVDVTGLGFWVPAVGVALLKDWGGVDWLLSVEGKAFLPRTFLETSSSRSFGQGWGIGFSAGAGISPARGPFRLGFQLSHAFETARTVTTTAAIDTKPIARWNVSLQASYRIADTWTLSAVYDDPLVLDGSKNTTLARSISVLVQQRFPL